MQRNYVIGLSALAALGLAGIAGIVGYNLGGRAVAQPLPPAPTCTLTASATSVRPGTRVNLIWTTSDAASASVDQGVGDVTLGSNAPKVVTPATTTTYTMTVKNRTGEANCTVTVTVAVPRPAARPAPQPAAPPAAPAAAPVTTTPLVVREPGAPLKTTALVYVGGVAVEQNPYVDNITSAAGHDGNRYFFQLYNRETHQLFVHPNIVGVNGQVRLVIRVGPRVIWSQEVSMVKGVVKTPLPVGTPIPVNAALCMETSWKRPYGVIPPRENISPDRADAVCTKNQVLYDWVNEGRGRTPEDAYGTIAIRSRS